MKLFGFSLGIPVQYEVIRKRYNITIYNKADFPPFRKKHKKNCIKELRAYILL